MKNKSRKANEKLKENTQESTMPTCDKIQFEEQPTQSKESSAKSKKSKNYDANTNLLKGRYYCQCETKKHVLINNCLNCGRIVCEQEGSGPCYTCGNLVCTPKEQAQFQGDTSKASKLYEHLIMRKKPKGLEEALEHRDKLLGFDKNTQKHTHVFDDDSDYFCASNPWLTLEERELVKKREEEFFNKKYESRLNKKITIDLKGQRILKNESKPNVNNYMVNNNKALEHQTHSQNQLSEDEVVDQLIDPYFAKFSIQFEKKLKSSVHAKLKMNSFESRIIDTELHQSSDTACCISVNQPWASFLVHGIKNGEGRTWYTSYRGRLWIASTGRRITPTDIKQCEKNYSFIKRDVVFPNEYPAGCLLGCVDLVDCLTQEQYRREFPDGEIEDPYVFICDNPRILKVHYPVKGKPNIYKLDEKIHKAASVCLKIS